MISVILGLRFLLELCLLAAMATIGLHLGVGWLVGTAAACLLAGATSVIWGLLLSPRRRVDAPLAARLLVELVLFAGAALGLAWVGFALLGVLLMTAELATVAVLVLCGRPPGSSGPLSSDERGGQR